MTRLNDSKTYKTKLGDWLTDNMVTLIFLVFTLLGFVVSSGVPFNFLIEDLTARFFRNAFLVLSLIIPVMAGLGLNFGIVIGAMAGQAAIIVARYFNIGGIGGLALCFVMAAPLAVVLGYLTGKLYNRTKGQEMIASLIVGFFADGVYQFVFLFALGVIIKVPSDHFMIKPDGIGIRTTVDMGTAAEGGLKYAMDNIVKIPLMWAVVIIGAIWLSVIVYRYAKSRTAKSHQPQVQEIINAALAIAVIAVGAYCIATRSIMMSIKFPVVTAIVILLLCIFTNWIMKTKLGQDFRSVGQSQNIAEVNGINVDRTRIIAVVISTVLAAWGQIIYLQNMGTLSTYLSHTQIGMFSVAALLVGGASIAKAGIKHAIIGTILFNAMFIMSPEIGSAMFGQPLLGEYFRTFMVYGVIGVALGLYVWKTNRQMKNRLD